MDYTIAADGRSITCSLCGRTSHNPNDVEYRYCGNCHRFLDIPDLVRNGKLEALRRRLRMDHPHRATQLVRQATQETQVIIGANLNQQEIAVLQAVAYNQGGAQFGRDSELPQVIENHRDCRAAEGLTPEQIEVILVKLAKEYLIERKPIAVKNKPEAPFSGLTDDGKRCNFISVDLL